MINFCVEPKKPCHKNPVEKLDFEIDKCYSSVYSRLLNHTNDSTLHVSQEERDEWNSKASNSALIDIQNQLNEAAGDGDNSIKSEVLLEVSKQIASAIADLNIEEYAKKKYVDDAIKSINVGQYVKKADADSTYLKIVDYTKFDSDSYYTKAEIQNMLKNSDIGKDYSIESFTLENNRLILKQKNNDQLSVFLSANVSGGGVDADYVQEQLSNYIRTGTLSKLIINDKTYSIESGRDIKIPVGGNGSNIDLSTFGYYKSYFKETSDTTIPTKPSANKAPENGSGWIETTPNYKAGHYIWMTQVFINGNGQYGEYTNPICLTGTAGKDAVSYDIKTSTDIINYQDGTMYPRVISVYVAKSDGQQVTNITPSNSSGWQFSYSTNGGEAWSAISSDQIQTEGDNGMLFRATKETIVLSKYVPIVKSGTNGATYQLQLSDMSLSYAKADQNYNLQMSCNVTLYENGSSIGDSAADIKMQLNSGDKTDLQYSSDHWAASVNTTVQSNSSVITIYAYNKNGAYLTSMAIPVSASADGSTGQTLKGSPLRIVGEWQKGTKYYDGKRDAGNGIFYQDVVLYENIYYSCINTNSGVTDNWNTTPDVATYFSAFSVTPNIVADLVIANSAFIKEISSNELVIFDDKKMVAGMTSSKKVDEYSPLNGKVTIEGKGDVRIWAGEISNGDLTTAPFTVKSNGNLTAHTATLYDATFYAENAQVKITNERTVTTGQVVENLENAGISISGNSEEYGNSEMFFGMKTTYPINIGGASSTSTKTTTPIAIVSNGDKKVKITPGNVEANGLDINGSSHLDGYTRINKLGRFVRQESTKASLDDMCSISINAGTFGSLEGDSHTIVLPDDIAGRDIIIVNPKWTKLIVKVPDGYTLYKYGTSVSEVQMSMHTMAHAIQISDTEWIIGMMM